MFWCLFGRDEKNICLNMIHKSCLHVQTQDGNGDNMKQSNHKYLQFRKQEHKTSVLIQSLNQNNRYLICVWMFLGSWWLLFTSLAQIIRWLLSLGAVLKICFLWMILYASFYLPKSKLIGLAKLPIQIRETLVSTSSMVCLNVFVLFKCSNGSLVFTPEHFDSW